VLDFWIGQPLVCDFFEGNGQNNSARQIPKAVLYPYSNRSKTLPQGLKPGSFRGIFGTTQVVP
jgi:hypothetical protein